MTSCNNRLMPVAYVNLKLIAISLLILFLSLEKLTAQQYAYVTSLSPKGKVTVIDITNNTVTGSIDVGAYPKDITITPDGNFVYVANSWSGNVSVINTSSMSVISTIGVGNRPESISITPDGNFVYVSNFDSKNIHVISTLSNTITDTISLFGKPRKMTITPDGRFAYISNDGEKHGLWPHIEVIDLLSNTISRVFKFGDLNTDIYKAYDIAFSPDGKSFIVTNADPNATKYPATYNQVTFLETARNRVRSSIEVGSNPISVAYTPDGKFVYVVNVASNFISVIDVESKNVIAEIPMKNQPYDIAITPDGKYGYVVNLFEKNILIIDIATNIVISAIPCDAPNSIVISPSPNSITKSIKKNSHADSQLNKLSLKEEQNQMETGTVTDFDGNVYRTVKIGKQWWMAENLKVTRYRNGKKIRLIKDKYQWSKAKVGAFCAQDNNPENVKTFGYLYNSYAANDSKGLAPEGWRIPSKADWDSLVYNIGGFAFGDKLVDTSNWKTGYNPENSNYSKIRYNNETGFTALTGGMRNDGEFGGVLSGNFYSSTKYNNYSYWIIVLGGKTVQYITGDYTDGFSIRCVKDE